MFEERQYLQAQGLYLGNVHNLSTHNRLLNRAHAWFLKLLLSESQYACVDARVSIPIGYKNLFM